MSHYAHDANKTQHNFILCAWLIDKFGIDFFQKHNRVATKNNKSITGGYVIDIAGGNGTLSFEMSVRYGINAILYESRKDIKLSSMMRRKMKKIVKNYSRHRNMEGREIKSDNVFQSITNSQSVLINAKSPMTQFLLCHSITTQHKIMTYKTLPRVRASIEHDDVLPFFHISKEFPIYAYNLFNTNKSDQNIISNNSDSNNNIRTTVGDTNNIDKTIVTSTAVANTTTSRTMTEIDDEEGDEDVEKQINEMSLLDLIMHSSLLIGVHSDEVTECIVDVAIALKVPFCVVPCCLFSHYYPHRQIACQNIDASDVNINNMGINDNSNNNNNNIEPTSNTNNSELKSDTSLPVTQGSDNTSRPVQSYEDFIIYLKSKHQNIQRDVLPFQGRNIVLYCTDYQ